DQIVEPSTPPHMSEMELRHSATPHELCQRTVKTRSCFCTGPKQMKKLVDELYPTVDRITLVMDNLNTHRMSSLYEEFTPEEARRLIEKIQVVHTPKHGSWLNMAECELSVMQKQCLACRIADEATLRKNVDIWNTDRNNRSKKVDWQFRTADARIKLHRLYPVIQME
ncbi:MAG: transposase, partial [Planctomycetia bacterium]|nr:transposase [Planctomycetia bacterium]